LPRRCVSREGRAASRAGTGWPKVPTSEGNYIILEHRLGDCRRRRTDHPLRCRFRAAWQSVGSGRRRFLRGPASAAASASVPANPGSPVCVSKWKRCAHSHLSPRSPSNQPGAVPFRPRGIDQIPKDFGRPAVERFILASGTALVERAAYPSAPLWLHQVMNVEQARSARLSRCRLIIAKARKAGGPHAGVRQHLFPLVPQVRRHRWLNSPRSSPPAVIADGLGLGRRGCHGAQARKAWETASVRLFRVSPAATTGIK